jgi:hypothetical protein
MLTFPEIADLLKSAFPDRKFIIGATRLELNSVVEGWSFSAKFNAVDNNMTVYAVHAPRAPQIVATTMGYVHTAGVFGVVQAILGYEAHELDLELGARAFTSFGADNVPFDEAQVNFTAMGRRFVMSPAEPENERLERRCTFEDRSALDVKVGIIRGVRAL